MAELPQCPVGVNCPGTDFPVSNFSSEAEDGPTFIGLSWPGGGGGTPTDWVNPPGTGGVVPGGGGPGVVPRPPNIGGGPVVQQQPILGSVWTAEGCFGTCFSVISQANADLCAALGAELCNDPNFNTTDHTPDTMPGTTPGAPGTPIQRFYNTAKQCQVPCGDGTYTNFTVPAGTFIGNSQADADQKAYSYACFTANSNRLCWDAVDEQVCAGEFASIEIVPTIAKRPPILFTVTGGSLPPGMSLANDSPSTALIEGTCNTAGVYVFDVTAADAVGQVVSHSCTISVVGVANSVLDSGIQGIAYSDQIQVVGCSGVCTVSAVSVLPPGMTIAPDGTISWPSPVAGIYSIIVNITTP